MSSAQQADGNGCSPAVFLLGATATGKTSVAVELVRRWPLSIVNVDSAQVYRGMDIGAAKPAREVLDAAPHRLIDIADPAERYNAGRFRHDALDAMEAITQAGRIPLLAGGTMLYFRALERGLAPLPGPDPALRATLDEQALAVGWPALHARLAAIDPAAGRRIHPNDAQRIQRALEVYELSGRPMTAWHQEATQTALPYDVIRLALAPPPREQWAKRIEKRFDSMLCAGFVEEVERLYRRGDLKQTTPSMRAVGYRQFWEHVAGRCSLAEAREKAIVATRQLAKRQMTWLRSVDELVWIDTGADFRIDKIVSEIIHKLREHYPTLC